MQFGVNTEEVFVFRAFRKFNLRLCCCVKVALLRQGRAAVSRSRCRVKIAWTSNCREDFLLGEEDVHKIAVAIPYEM